MTTQDVIQLAGAVGAGGIATAFFSYWSSRSKDQRLAKIDVEKFAQTLIKTALETADNQMKTMAAELKDIHAELVRLRDQHRKCESDLRDITYRLDVRDRDVVGFRAQIDQLMAGPIPDYTPGDYVRQKIDPDPTNV